MRGIGQEDTEDQRAPTGQIWKLSVKYILTVTGNPRSQRGIHPDDIHNAMGYTDTPPQILKLETASEILICGNGTFG